MENRVTGRIKRRLMGSCLFLCLSLLLTACNNDDDSSSNKPTEKTPTLNCAP